MAYIEINKKYKGKLDISILIASYEGALNKLKQMGVDSYEVYSFDNNFIVNINKQRSEVNRFIKRGIVLDLKEKGMLDKYLNSKKLSENQKELLNNLSE